MEICALDQIQIEKALPLVWKVFCDYEAANYSESDKQAFFDAIHDEEYISSLQAFGAFEGDTLVGIIATRNGGRHVALFFVDGAFHRQGIGRRLWNTFLEKNEAPIITVNSSIYAVEVYKKLGFEQKGMVQEADGMQFVPMQYNHLLTRLQDKDDKKAYDYVHEIIAKSADSNAYYAYFDDFVEMTHSKSSFMRTRGFLLCCAQARWDTERKFEKAFEWLRVLLHDEKPTVVRQSLAALHQVILYHPELCDSIEGELNSVDLSKYRDSMIPLIKKDINELRRVM